MANRNLAPYSAGRSMRRGGFSPFAELQREMNQLFEDVFGRTSGEAGAGTGPERWMTPRIDVSEAESGLKICAEIPGVDQKDVEVTVEDDILTIRGEKRSETEEDQPNYHVSERSFGRFHRSIQLPFSPNPDEVRASFSNGVLTVTLPRSAQARERARRIDVQSGAAGTKQEQTKH